MKISSPSGHVVTSVTVGSNQRYDVRLAPADYTLSATYFDEPCSGRVTIKANATVHANTVCEGK